MTVDALTASLDESCMRYATHRRMQEASCAFYDRLTRSDKNFFCEWIAALPWCTAEVADGGRWAGVTGEALQKKLAVRWGKIFAKDPPQFGAGTHYVYRAVWGEHAARLISAKVGDSLDDIDRYSSFAHSPEMAKRFGLMLLGGGEPVAIVCLRVRRSTPYVFLSGWHKSGGLSAFVKKRPQVEDIDRTQGELVLAPTSVRKVAPNTARTLCDGFLRGAANTTSKVTLIQLREC